VLKISREARIAAVLCAAFVGSISSSAEVHAADPADVEALISEGIALRRQGKDHRALSLFQKAHQLASTRGRPRSLAWRRCSSVTGLRRSGTSAKR
jgi:hypothetical protein